MARPSSVYVVGSEQADELRTANMCVYSYPGAGKTVLWGSGDKHVIIMESDPEGVLAAEQQGFKPVAIRVTDYNELIEAYEWVKHDVPNELPDVKWVAWDSLTLFQDRALIDDVLVDAAAANPRQSEDIASMREYLVNMNRIGKYIRMFVDLPLNFGVSCHVQVEEDPEGNLVYMPQVQGKNMPSKISGYMNIVGYLGRTESGKRRLLTETSNNFFAKDRFHALRTNGKPHLNDPDLPQIQRLLNASRKKAGTTPARPRRRRSARNE